MDSSVQPVSVERDSCVVQSDRRIGRAGRKIRNCFRAGLVSDKRERDVKQKDKKLYFKLKLVATPVPVLL